MSELFIATIEHKTTAKTTDVENYKNWKSTK